MGALDHTAATAMGTRCAEGALKGLLDALTGNRNQSEVIELKDFRRRLVDEAPAPMPAMTLTITALFHINEIGDDDSTEVAKSDLACDFLGSPRGVRFDDDSIFKTI